MKKENLLFAIVGILAGFIGGFFLANSINRNAMSQATVAQNTPNAPFLNGQNSPQTQSVSIKDGNNGGMIAEVQQTLDRAKNEPNNFEAQISAGEMYLKIQNVEKANEFFQRAAAANPKSFAEFATLGNAFFDIKNYEEAEKWYTQALAKNPDSVDVRTDLGSTFMQRSQPDFDRAIKEYRISLEKDPNHENTIFNLSLALMFKGDKQGAQEMLAQLKKVNPQSSLIAQLEQKLSANNSSN